MGVVLELDSAQKEFEESLSVNTSLIKEKKKN